MNTSLLYSKHEKSLSTAQKLRGEEEYNISTSRLFYSAFQIVKCLALKRKVIWAQNSAPKEGAKVHAGAERLVYDTFGEKAHELYTRFRQLRNKADYSDIHDLSKESPSSVECKEMEDFIKLVVKEVNK